MSSSKAPQKVRLSVVLTDKLVQLLSKWNQTIRALTHDNRWPLDPEELRALERIQCTGIFRPVFEIRRVSPGFSVSNSELAVKLRTRLSVVSRHARIPGQIAESLLVVVDRLTVLRPILVERQWRAFDQAGRALDEREKERVWKVYRLLRTLLRDLVELLPLLPEHPGVTSQQVDADQLMEFFARALHEYSVFEKTLRSSKFPEAVKSEVRKVLLIKSFRELGEFVHAKDTPNELKAFQWFHSYFPSNRQDFFPALHAQISWHLEQLARLNKVIFRTRDPAIRHRLERGATVLRIHLDFLLSSVILHFPEQ